MTQEILQWYLHTGGTESPPSLWVYYEKLKQDSNIVAIHSFKKKSCSTSTYTQKKFSVFLVCFCKLSLPIDFTLQ